MAFLCPFSGLTIGLMVWVALYTLASDSDNPLLGALAPYLEALGITGQCFFVILAVVFAGPTPATCPKTKNGVKLTPIGLWRSQRGYGVHKVHSIRRTHTGHVIPPWSYGKRGVGSERDHEPSCPMDGP